MRECDTAPLHASSGDQAPLSLDEVLASRPVAPATNLLECARRADGGAAFIVADSNFIDATLGHDARPQSGCARRIRDTSTTRPGRRRRSLRRAASPPLSSARLPRGVASSCSGGERRERPALLDYAAMVNEGCACYYQASGPLYPPPRISDEVFSCEHAAGSAYSEAQLLPSDIDWFGLYDWCVGARPFELVRTHNPLHALMCPHTVMPSDAQLPRPCAQGGGRPLGRARARGDAGGGVRAVGAA